MAEREMYTITLKKDHFFIILIAVFFVIGLGAGSALSGGGFDFAKNGAPSKALAPTPSPSPSPAPTAAAAAGGRVNVPNGADDDAFLGDANAPVTVIEFSDFQCPFCRKFWEQTLPQLKQNYIDTGKVKFVYRDLPLNFHPGAQPYALAAECAEDQGIDKWEAMHDKIFEEQAKSGGGTVPYPGDDAVKQWAADISLDTSSFNECFDSNKYGDEINKDLADASAAGASGTPTVFIGNDKDGYIKIVGAQPYSAFQQAIDAELA